MRSLKSFLKNLRRSKHNEEAQEAQEVNSDILASITYSIDNKGESYIDASLSSFDDEVIESLSELICLIFTEGCHVSTTEMISTNFVTEGKTEELEKLLSLIIQKKISQVSERLISSAKESGEPCIKPSDML